MRERSNSTLTEMHCQVSTGLTSNSIISGGGAANAQERNEERFLLALLRDVRIGRGEAVESRKYGLGGGGGGDDAAERFRARGGEAHLPEVGVGADKFEGDDAFAIASRPHGNDSALRFLPAVVVD